MDKDEFVGIKMRKGLILSKKGGQLTPVPSWKMEEEEAGPLNSYAINRKNTTSARKLGACLWEVQNQSPMCNFNLMGKSKAITSEPNSPISLPESAFRCLKNTGTSYDQHDLCRRINVDLNHQPSAVIDSSVETSSLDPTVTQRCSLNLKGRSSGHNTRTSAELVRVLNRIWRLEEELASSVSLVKTLKADLHHAHSHIQELMQKQQSYRFEINDLMARVSQNKLSRTDKGHDKLMITIQSLNHEIEDGKKARYFLEDLCDEFAKGLLEYEQESGNNTSDQSLHHLSKLWMDERLKTRTVEGNGNKYERKKVPEKINPEILSYLQKKKLSGSKNGRKKCDVRHQSFESVRFNGNVSAPKEDDDDDSTKSDFHCLELKADSKINQHSLEGSRGKHRDTLVNETEKMDSHAECSMIQDTTSLSNRHKSHLLDSSRGNSSDSAMVSSVKDNSLKKKLIEARLEGQHARLRAFKGSSAVA